MLSGLLRRHAPRPGQNSLLATALLRGEPSTAVVARCLCARARKKPWQKDAAPKGPREGEQALKLKDLRLICDTGEQLGVVTPAAALKLADERGLRLVEVAAASKPTVWKLMTAEQAVARQPPPSRYRVAQLWRTRRRRRPGSGWTACSRRTGRSS